MQQRARFEQAARAHASGKLADAEAAYRALLAERVRFPPLNHQLAQLYLQSGRYREAERAWNKALEIDPAFVQARYLLGNLYKSQGALDKAATCYRRALETRPDYTPAHYNYAAIHRYSDRGDPHLAAMQKLYGKAVLADESRTHLAFALAKAYEDFGDYDGAFGFLEAGNRIRSREYNYDISSDRDLVENIIETFSAEAVAGLAADADPSGRPIFIIGMPRSGTSLVEKILSTHSAVHGAGELQDFYALAAGLFLDPADHYRFRPLQRCPADAFRRLGRAYLDRLARLEPAARHVSDKLPFNLLMAGLIRLSLPNAKIIHCRRDARDTGLSIYKQNFTTANYRFAYDLRSIGQFQRLYEGLMEHWHAVFPGAIHDVSYEALAGNPDTEIPRLIEACGLEWEADCLDFSRSAGTVNTASAVQVRRPMYTSSIGLWEKYRDHLSPLLDALDGP